MLYRRLKMLEKIVNDENETFVQINRDVYLKILKSALRSVDFDEKFYLAEYPDIARAIKNGQLADPKTHFVRSGYFEERLPYKLLVDPNFYTRANPDVARAIQSGVVKSAEEHFFARGILEGREPSENFSLFNE